MNYVLFNYLIIVYIVYVIFIFYVFIRLFKNYFSIVGEIVIVVVSYCYNNIVWRFIFKVIDLRLNYYFFYL